MFTFALYFARLLNPLSLCAVHLLPESTLLCQFLHWRQTYSKPPLPPHLISSTTHTHALILSRSPQRKLKPDPLARQRPLHLRIRIKPIIHPAPRLLIQHNLEHLTPVLARAGPLPHNLDGVHDVAEYGVVDGGQGPAVWALLRLRGAGAVGAFGAGEDAAGGKEEDVAV